MEVCVGSFSDFEEENQTIVHVAKMEVGIFRLGNEIFAYENKCPHQGGPACEGKIIPKVISKIDKNNHYQGDDFDENEMHFVCPWHGWEYDMRTGRHAGDPRMGLRAIEILEREEKVYLII